MGPMVDPNDPAPLIGLQAVFLAVSVLKYGGIIRVIDILLEYIVHEIIIRGADIRIVQLVQHPDQRGGIVVAVIVLIDDDIHAERFLQVEELLFHVANYNRDVPDSDLLQLADLSFNQHFAFDGQNTLGFFIGKRCKTGGHPRCHDNGIVYFVRP